MAKNSLHVFVIGLPASGKTTICNELRRQMPEFAYATDLFALNELADINQILASGLSPTTHSWRYWSDMVSSVGKQNIPTEYEINRDNDGRLNLTSPEIWDEGLRRTYIAWADRTCLLYEFSRGPDPAYKAHLHLKDHEIYPHSLDILDQESHSKTTKLVLHLACSRNVAEERNRNRRKSGHGLSTSAMNMSYAYDPFSTNSRRGQTKTAAPNPLISWPVLSLISDQSSPKTIADRAAAWIKERVDRR